MAGKYSCYAITVEGDRADPHPRKTVISQDSDGRSALQIAMEAVRQETASATFSGAELLGGSPIDLAFIADANSEDKKIFAFHYPTRRVLVYVAPAAGVRAEDYAIERTVQSIGSMPTNISIVASVDIDATTDTPLPPPLTKFEFRKLFTLSELVAIDNADANATLNAEIKAMLRTFMATFAAAQDISLSDPTTQAGVNYLATVGLLTAERAAAILSGQSPA